MGCAVLASSAGGGNFFEPGCRLDGWLDCWPDGILDVVAATMVSLMACQKHLNLELNLVDNLRKTVSRAKHVASCE